MQTFLPLRRGSHVAVCACSNALPHRDSAQVDAICAALRRMGLVPCLSPALYADTPGGISGEEKAQILEYFYNDDQISAIFDLSGGDLANDVLLHLDMDVLRRHPKPFFGYSDLTCLLNAFYTAAGVPGGLYTARNLVRADALAQQARLEGYLLGTSRELTRLRVGFVQGSAMEGILVGGNLRCLLKLAGTPFFPDVRERILLLESMGGTLPRIRTMLGQLALIGVFEQVSGVLLGTFSEYDATETTPIESLLLPLLSADTPLARTPDVGHGADTRCAEIGCYYHFSNRN